MASFYNYYPTKAALLIALAEDFHEEATELAVLPYRSGLPPPDALREAVAGVWRTYAKRRGELIGVFQAGMLETEFLDLVAGHPGGSDRPHRRGDPPGSGGWLWPWAPTRS